MRLELMAKNTLENTHHYTHRYTLTVLQHHMVATPLKALAPTAKTNQLLLLLSEGVSDPIQEGACRRAKSLMEAHNVDAIVVDGMDPEQKDRRNELFAISQIRGKVSERSEVS